MRTRSAASTASGTSGAAASGSGGAGLAPTGGASGPAAAGGSIDARVPATFALGVAGALSPAQVSAPAFLAIAVRITSASGSAHTATIATPHPVALRIPPHGAAATRIPGLRAGTYPILIDGVRRGALLIGGEPGP